MFYFAIIFIFVLGLLVGSFLNVVILRYNTGLSIANGRSRCFSCGKILRWYELVPVLSFVALRGKCSKCGAHISWQYPAIELLTGFLFVLVFVKSLAEVRFEYVGIATAFAAVIWSILVVILAYDIRHKIIPDGLVYAFAFLSLVQFFTTIDHSLLSKAFVVHILAGPILFLPFFLLWLVSRGKWIGLGDGKLALGIGWFLGLGLGVSAVVIAFWIGAAVSILVLVFERLRGNKSITMKTEIPFAPFLILGTAVVYFFTVDVVGLHALFGL